MIRYLVVVLGFGALLSCAASSPVALPDGVTFIESNRVRQGEIGISYDKFRLQNGLTVLLHQDKSDPLVHVNVTYHVGSAREEAGKSGFAHFFEHMMFEGSVNAPDDLHTELVDAMGGSMNGGTNSDTTRYYNTVPANELEKMVWLEADRMGFVLPMVTQEKFEIQRATVKNERAQRYDNSPYGMRSETMGKALYPKGHPYSWPVIGYVEDLNRVGLNDLKAFFKRWYGPNNATLVIAGDFDKAQALLWVKQYFGGIPRGPAVEPKAKEIFTLSENRYVAIEDSKIRLPLLQIAFPTVYLHHDDEAPLDFLSQILGDGKNSVLYQKLVKTGKAVQTAVSHPCRELACEFSLYVVANPASGTTLSEIEQIVRDSLTEWATQAATDEGMAKQLEKFQRMFKSSTIYGLEKVSGKAAQLAGNEIYFNQPDTVAYDLERYGAVTPEEVIRVYNKYLKSGSVVLSVMPEGQLAGAAKPSNFKLPEPLQPEADTLVQQEVKPPQIMDDFDRSMMPPTGPAVKVTPPQSWQATLSNGIEVKGATTSETPTVSVSITLEGGTLLEPMEKAGLATLTAQMMTESSQLRSAEALADALDSYGSQVDFQASGRTTEVNISSLVEFLPQTLAIAQEMLFKPGFKEEDFNRVKQRTLQLRNQSKSDPKFIAQYAKRQLLWGKEERLGLPNGGTFETVANITLDDVKAYYHHYYSPAMASVVVVGNLEQELAINELKFLEAWQGKAVELPSPVQQDGQYQGKIVLVDHPGAAQAVMTFGRPALPYDATGEFFKLNLTNHALGGNFTSRVNLLLREEKGYTYGAYSRFNGDKTQGHFALQANLLQDKTADAVQDTLALLERYSSEGPSSKEVATMRSAVTQREALRYESTGQKASLLGHIQYHGLPDDYVKQQQAIIQTISEQELKSLAKNWLDPKSMWILVVADASKVESKLKQIKGWQLEKLSLH